MKLTQKISKQSFYMGLIVLLPAYLLFGSVILSAIFQFIESVLGIAFDDSTLNGYFNFVFDLVFVVISFLIFRKEIIEQWKSLKEDKLQFINNVALGIPILYLASITGNLLSALLTGELTTSENQILIESMLQQLPLLMILTVTILAPILEEFVFRLLLFTGFYKKSRWLAYLVSAGSFGLLHVFQSMLQGNIAEIFMVFPYLFMGAGLCFLYEKADNIFAPMLAHGIINTISVVMLMV